MNRLGRAEITVGRVHRPRRVAVRARRRVTSDDVQQLASELRSGALSTVRRRRRRPTTTFSSRRSIAGRGRMNQETTVSHYLYLVRHGEQQDAEHGLPDGPLSERGKRQARAARGAPRRRPVRRGVALAARARRRDGDDHDRADAGPDDRSRRHCSSTASRAARRPTCRPAFKPFFGGVTEDGDRGRARRRWPTPSPSG